MSGRRFPLAVRLTLILAAVAVLSVAFALTAQDRGIADELRDAAATRLSASSRAADHLVAEALRDLAHRQASVSSTPEFRAHLEIGDRATLERFARELAARMPVSAVMFLDRDGRSVAGSGPAAVLETLRGAWMRREVPAALGCVEAVNPRPAGDRERKEEFAPCTAPVRTAQATLVTVGKATWLTAAVSLETAGRRLGTLVSGEPLDDARLAAWSELAGASLEIARRGPVPTGSLVRTVRNLGDRELRVVSTFAFERAALVRARRKALGAGLIAIALSAAGSVLLARSFVRPIREIQHATERIGEGDLEVRLSIRRADEIGDVANAFDATLDRLRQSQERLRRVQRMAQFGDWSLDLASGTIEGSLEFRRLLGLPSGGPIALEAILAAVDAQDLDALRAAIESCRLRRSSLEIEVRLARRARRSRVVELSGRCVRQGTGGRLEASIHDVTERRRSEEQIRFLAYRDSLTGLGNRRFLLERLEIAIARPDAPPFGLLFLDLDRFKLVNDTLGHATGDALLRDVAARLWSSLDDPDGAAVARLGGDEFTLFVPGGSDGARAREAASAVLEALSQPFDVDGQQVSVGGSIGIALWPQHGPDAAELLRCCDTALHRAKAEGRNRFRFYDASLQDAAIRRFRLEHRLRAAIETETLQVFYQPRVDAQTSRIVGFEALLRWTDDELGPVPPAAFVPLAEETGLIAPLGEWVLRTAMAQLSRWRIAGLPVEKVSINLSGRQLRPELLAQVQREFARSGVEPPTVEFEVTESAVMDDQDVGIAVLRGLRRLGARTSLDDFGTGHSSLSMLRTLPLDAVKIDRSFVRNLGTDPRDTELAASIVSMANVLGLSVVVEGVETKAQRDLLREMRCDELQGYLFGEAVPAERVPELLANPRRKRRDG
jgi:diguanylate cyclase (GGDEF)-like protein